MSQIRIIGRNIRFLAMSRLASVLVSFFLFPFIVRHVGKDAYGVYLIAMTVTGYFGLLDLGVLSALTKYVAEYRGKGDPERIRGIVSASFSFYVLIGLVICVLLFACAAFFTEFFVVDAAAGVVMRQLFGVAGVSALLTWPLATFRGIVQGQQLWHLEASVNMAVQAVNAVATILILAGGLGIVELFAASQTIGILAGLYLYRVARRNLPFRISFPYWEFETYRFIFSFSFFMFAGSLLNVFLFQVHNLIIGYFLSMSAVTVYAVAYNIQSYFRYINATIGAPPWTVASEMEGRGDYEGQRNLLFKGTKLATAVFLPVVIIVFFFAEPFIFFWMGPDFQESVVPALVIIPFWLFNGTSELAVGMLSAKGIVREPLRIQLAVAAANIVIGVSLIRVFGITAIALGLTLSMVFIGFPLLLRLSLRSLNVSFREYFRRTVWCNLPLYGFVLMTSFAVSRVIHPSNLAVLLAEMGLIYGGSLLLYYRYVLDSSERRNLFRLVGVGRLAGGAVES